MAKKKEEAQKLIVFKLPETVQFPTILFDKAKSMDNVQKLITENGFIAIQQKNVIANRLMDIDEVNQIREEYGEIAEQELPDLHDQLATLEAKFKSDKKQFEAQISAANTKFKDLVAFAKNGIKDYPLEMPQTLRIPVLNHYLFYTWVNDRFELALVQEIPFHERHDVFNSIEKNKKVFEDMGFALPEIDTTDSRKNLKRFSKDGIDYEAWEVDGLIRVTKLWTEELSDEETGEERSIEHKEEESFTQEDYPYSEYEQIEAQEGEADEVQGESEE